MLWRPAPFAARFLRLTAIRALVLVALWGLTRHDSIPPLAGWSCIALDAVFLLWQMRCYHSMAEDHIRDTGAMAASWGGYLLWFFASLVSLTLWWEIILLAHHPVESESYDSQMRRAREALYALTLSTDHSTVRFQGEITFGLKARLSSLLEVTPDVRRIELSGPGGHVYEARGTAQLILEYGLDTLAVGDCSSACTLLFLAGSKRRLAPEGRLGFHGYGLAQVTHLPGYDITTAEAKDRDYLISRGVAEDFARRAFATPATSMWFPTETALRKAEVLRD